jgi:hypothetical protein
MSGAFVGRVEPQAKSDNPRLSIQTASQFAALIATYAGAVPA